MRIMGSCSEQRTDKNDGRSLRRRRIALLVIRLRFKLAQSGRAFVVEVDAADVEQIVFGEQVVQFLA